MKPRNKLCVAAGVVFAASFFMPALGDSSGFSCFLECWKLFAGFGADSSTSLGGWLYYSGFVAANALFVGLWAAFFFTAKYARARFWASAIIMLQVLSWLVLNLFSHGDRFGLGVGYFVWLLAFALLCVAQRSRKVEPAVTSVDGSSGPASRLS